MKSIAIFLLVGLSLFHNGNCFLEGEEGIVPPIANCVVDAVKNTPALLDKLKDIFCMYAEGQSTGNAETLKAVITEVKEFLKESCTKEEITVLGISLDDTIDNVAQTADELVNALQPTLNKLTLTKPVMDALCKTLNAITKSKCLKNAITNTADLLKNLVSALTKLKCEKFSMDNLKKIFTEVRCAVPEVLENLELVDKEISKEVENLLKNSVIDKVVEVLNNPELTKLVNSLLCSVKKVVDHLSSVKWV